MITLCLTPMFYVMAAEKKKVMLIIRNTFIINMINLVIIIKSFLKLMSWLACSTCSYTCNSTNAVAPEQTTNHQTATQVYGNNS